jgi:hypothetical protein
MNQHLTEQETEAPLDEALRLVGHLRELLLTQQTATGSQVSARLLPVVAALEDAVGRIGT